MTAKPIRVAVVGVGHVGTLHAQVYRKLAPQAQLVAVCDANTERARDIARQFGCDVVSDAAALIGHVDAASVCVPTSFHHAVGRVLLAGGVHVLMEKPIATSLREADELVALAARRRLVLQVGHIERFNAAIHAARRYLTHPRFIEAHRLSPYPFRGTDVSVILDVMVHDLDLVLAITKSQPVRIDAVGVPVLSTSEDIANVRLVFTSGCVANLTASRVSDESLRRLRVFQEDCYLSIDYKHQTVEVARKMHGTIRRETLDVQRRPPLDDELSAFLHAIRSRRRPPVPGEEAREVLALALAIERTMRRGRESANSKRRVSK